MRLLIFFLFYFCPLSASQLSTLYNSLDPKSIPQHLALYDLYPETLEGKKALKHAWSLLSASLPQDGAAKLMLPLNDTVHALIALINKQPGQETPLLNQGQLEFIENLSLHLANRQLQGRRVQTEQDILNLPAEQIDLARALFLTQFGSEDFQKIQSYEAALDLMALQVIANLPEKPSSQDKIRGISRLIFDEMGYRFPPHSLYAQDVDIYTFLPSVLDSRQGVCLGVSILYLCLAQRVGLELEAVTPPGHIYIRYKNGDFEINIETTARGVHVDSIEYLGVDTRKLQQRTIKEVVGLTHFNQASVYLRKSNYEEALKCYYKALPYLPGDMQLKELIGLASILTGDLENGSAYFRETLGYVPDFAVKGDTLTEDFLCGNVDGESLSILFLDVDETRESILNKKERLSEVLKKHPKFRQGWHALAISWLQLHRTKEALEVLLHYEKLDPEDAEAEYYLAVLHAERLQYAKAWEHLRRAETLTGQRNHHPKVLKNLRKELSMVYPE